MEVYPLIELHARQLKIINSNEFDKSSNLILNFFDVFQKQRSKSYTSFPKISVRKNNNEQISPQHIHFIITIFLVHLEAGK